MVVQVHLVAVLRFLEFRFLIKSSLNLIKKIIQPRGVFIPTYNSREISEDILTSVTGYFFLYIFVFATLSLVLAFDGQEILTSLSGAAATLANVGPGLNEIIGPSGNYSSISDFTKLFFKFRHAYWKIRTFSNFNTFITAALEKIVYIFFKHHKSIDW